MIVEPDQGYITAVAVHRGHRAAMVAQKRRHTVVGEAVTRSRVPANRVLDTLSTSTATRRASVFCNVSRTIPPLQDSLIRHGLETRGPPPLIRKGGEHDKLLCFEFIETGHGLDQT